MRTLCTLVALAMGAAPPAAAQLMRVAEMNSRGCAGWIHPTPPEIAR